MTLFYSSPSSYSTSTQSNPFYQGGWKSHIQRDETPQPRHLTDLHSNWEGSSVYTIPTAWPSATQPFRPASDLPSTTLLFSPLPSCNGQLINCVVSGGQTVYTVNTDNPGLTLVKDAARRPVALIEWASMPVIDIRGDKGKKRLDQWLIRDKVLPNMHLMQWKGTWYCWTTDASNIYLYEKSRFTHPLAVVRASGAMFEVEFSSDAIKCGLVEPSVVAVILLHWQNGYFA